MERSTVKTVFVFIILFGITIILGRVMYSYAQVEYFRSIIHQNIVLFLLLLTLIKIIGLVWPPLPGGVFTLAAIPLVGWKNAFLVDCIGNIIGVSISFYLGRVYGERIIHNLFPPKVMQFIKRIKVNPQKEMEGIFLVTLATGFFLVEVTSYGLGFLKVRYKNFIIANVTAHLIRGLPVYYLVGNLISGRDVILNVVLLLITIPTIVFAWRRYIDFAPPEIPS